MLRYIIRRLIIIPVALILIIFLAYSYAHLVQWDYASRYGQLRYNMTVYQQRPESLWVALGDYARQLLRFDLGKLRNGEAIIIPLSRAFVASMGLMGVALILSAPIGILLGLMSAQWRRLRPARWLTVVSTGGLAMPSFYVGSLLILISVAYALWSHSNKGLPFPLAGFGWDLHLVFPTIALMLRPTVQIAQVTGNSLTDELQKPYVTASRSMGHSKATIKRKLAFRNVIAPVILTIAASLRTLVTDLILVEWLFFWPGLGRFLASALIPADRTNMASSPYFLDPPFVAALLGTITALFLVADFLASIIVRILDPRLRVPAAEEVSGV